MDYFHSDKFPNHSHSDNFPDHENKGGLNHYYSQSASQPGPVGSPGGLTVNFGCVAIGRRRLKNFKLYNPSLIPQTFFVTKFPNPDSGFKWMSPNLPITIQASSTVLLPVKFSPSDVGSAMEVVHLQVYDGSLKFSACLKGVGFYSRKLILQDQMWTLYEQDKVAKLRAVTVIQRWWRRRLMRESVTKKWNQLIDDYYERRDEAGRFIQQSWKSFVERRKKERSRAIGVIEGAVKYYLVRRKWIQSLNQLRARIRLEELIELNESAAMKSAMITLKVSLHEVNHLQRLQSSMSSSKLTDDERTMYRVVRIKRPVQVIGSFFKYIIICNRWLEVMEQVRQQIIRKEKITTSAIMIQRSFRLFLVRKKWKQIVTEVMKDERRKQIEAMSETPTPVTITGGIAIAVLVYLLTCKYTLIFHVK